MYETREQMKDRFQREREQLASEFAAIDASFQQRLESIRTKYQRTEKPAASFTDNALELEI